MKRFIASVLTFLILSSAITPAVLAGGEKKQLKQEMSESINDYQKDLYDLNKKIAKVYRELNNSQKFGDKESIYVHVIETAKDTAELIGKTNKLAIFLVTSGFDTANTSLSSRLRDVAVNGFSSEVKEKLIQAGYTSEDITALEKKIMEYNAYLYRISTQGFTSEEIQSLKNAGYSDNDIENLRDRIAQRYFSNFSAAEQLNASKNEFYQIQVMFSILALKLLENSSEEKGKISSEQIRHLGKLEQRLIEDISKLDSEKKKWEHIKEDGKELYKYSEMLIKKSGNASAFSADYFIGMQIYLAAITALEGDEGFALDVINSYKPALEDLASKRLVEKEEKKGDHKKSEKDSDNKVKSTSAAKSLTNLLKFEVYKISSGIKILVLKAADKIFSIPIVKALSPIVGQVDELREDNNIAEITVTLTNPSDPELSSMVPLWVVVGGVTVTSSATLAEIIASLLAPEVIILAAVAVGVYVVVTWASNPTVYRYPEERRELPDGKYMIIKRYYRLNGDVSVIVVIYDRNGNQLAVYHIVYDKHGRIIHGPERKPESNDPTQELPDQNYFPDVYPPPGF